MPTVLTAPLIASGELVPVLAGAVGAQTQFMLVYPERELMLPAVRVFIEAVVTWAADGLGRDRPWWPVRGRGVQAGQR